MCSYIILFSCLFDSDEDLLGRGLELNDSLQTLLAKHDAIASGSPLPIQGSGSPLPIQGTNLCPKPTEVSSSSLKSTEVGDSSPRPNGTPPAPVATVTKGLIDEEEEEEDDFAQLARRLFKINQFIFSTLFSSFLCSSKILQIVYDVIYNTYWHMWYDLVSFL